ncbi:hypothetical protein [Amycolatopsis sp. NPDC051903]|uniref:hypothetical protein n=1 Tax=Amycolatopsis sp. NPDC051903 TaxID=3363936 RepID=UPI003790A252
MSSRPYQPGELDARRRAAGQGIDRYRALRAGGLDEASALAQVGPERSLAGQAAIGFAFMTGSGVSEDEARVQAVHDAVVAEAVEQGYEIWREGAAPVPGLRPEWMDELEQAATRAVAERHHDRAFLRSLDAAGEADPARRAGLEAEARALSERAEAFTARAAELGRDNDPVRELEIQHTVDGIRERGLNATFDAVSDQDADWQQTQPYPTPLGDGQRMWLQALMRQGMSMTSAERFVRTHDRADAGITRYRQGLEAGLSDEAAAARAASGDEVADAAIMRFRDQVAQGRDASAAHFAAQAAAVDAALGSGDNQESLFSGDALRAPDQTESSSGATSAPTMRLPDDDVEVIVIDPAELMPADVALRNYFTAESAVEQFERVLAETGDADRARAEVDSAFPEESAVANAAVERYEQLRIAGRGEEEARSQVARDVADRMTPGLSAEEAARVAAAFAEPAVGEGDVNDADWRWNPPASSLVPEREPEAGSWIARNLPATPDLVVPDEYEPDYLTPEEDELEQLAFDNGEEGVSPYLGMAAPMVVNQSGVLRSWGPAPDATHAHFVDDGDDDVSWPMLRSTDPTVAEFWAAVHAELDRIAPPGTPERAQAVLAEAAEIREHINGCTRETAQCETCHAQWPGDGRFWETDVPAAQLLLDADTTAVESGIASRDTAEVLDRIDGVLAEPEPSPLAEVVEQCGRAVDEASDATHRIAVIGADTERAQRLARWNADDQTHENTEGWERA